MAKAANIINAPGTSSTAKSHGLGMLNWMGSKSAEGRISAPISVIDRVGFWR